VTTDQFFKWAPLVLTGIQILLLPVILIVLRNQIEKVLVDSTVLDNRIRRALSEHNSDIYSHPALADLKVLEGNILKLTDQVRDLVIKIERITPRRRTDGPFIREE
jgi:hypothetical protein